MIDSNREEFEKLPEIAEIIKEGVFWNGEIYRRTAICKLTHLYYVRGAWYSFQEQQKKLDCCREENKAHLEKIDELQARVDKVVHILTYTNHASTPLCNELRDILKGNKDD